ncbi:MAG: response regulator [Acidobacteriota bacterium]
MSSGKPGRSEQWRKYLEDSAHRLALAESQAGRLQSESGSREALESLQSIFHDFAGSGALYGLPEVSALGGEGEYLCTTVGLSERPATLAEVDQVATLIRRLRTVFQRVMTGPEGPRPPADAPRSTPLLLLAGSPSPERSAMADFLLKRGLQVEGLDGFRAAVERFRAGLPDLLATEVSLPDGTGFDLVRRFREIEGERSIPVLLLGAPELFHDKVEAIACGADGFLPSPVDPSTLFRKFRILLGRRRAASGRVLAVEDDPSQAAFLETTLKAGGYQVRMVTEPMAFEREIHAFRPELILMDVLLPGVSGYDLVRFLRQEEGFSTVPVVFLTTEGRRRAQIRGAEAGGDDYLVKPVTPEDLLTTVKSRLIRYRSLQEMMDRDELTGLLAHTPFLQQARLCLSRFTRRQVPYALVLVEIDGMEARTREAGARARDVLIQGLAKYLQRKVRQTDVMGRYGDQCLALVLEHLSPTDAVRLLDRLQTEFSQMDWPVETDRRVRASFSAGAAMASPSMKTLKAWLDAASGALKSARLQGGGRVALAPPTEAPPG